MSTQLWQQIFYILCHNCKISEPNISQISLVAENLEDARLPYQSWMSHYGLFARQIYTWYSFFLHFQNSWIQNPKLPIVCTSETNTWYLFLFFYTFKISGFKMLRNLQKSDISDISEKYIIGGWVIADCLHVSQTLVSNFYCPDQYEQLFLLSIKSFNVQEMFCI